MYLVIEHLASLQKAGLMQSWHWFGLETILIFQHGFFSALSLNIAC